ncbi:hypothetical protein LPJ81_005526 [Coemansia sp. IMI 209127]|nr:hypothetical protein LPJ81_005526 [Coemansia sp. IMI 209127]
MPKVYALVSRSSGESHFLGLNDGQTVQDLIDSASSLFNVRPSKSCSDVLRLLAASAAPFEDQTDASKYANVSAATTMAQCLELGDASEPLFFEFHESKSLSDPSCTATVRAAAQNTFGAGGLIDGDSLLFAWKDSVVDACTAIGPDVQSTAITTTISIVSQDV